MTAYWSNECGRYGTGESYDYFPKYEEGVETFESEDGLWTCTNLEDGIELLRYNGSEANLTVPSEMMGRRVVSLESTFDGFTALKSIVIPESVTSIEGAFYGCESLEQVSLPEHIVSLHYAFNCCFELKRIDLPAALKNASWAFESTGIRTAKLPDGIEDISHAFMNCGRLERAYIPGTAKDLTEAFTDCESLREVSIENGVTRIGDYAFFNCISLKELTIPESVTEFGKKSVGVMEIREYASPEKLAFRIKGYQVVPGFQIKGKAGSKAEEYARENGIEFVRI
ncbi:MAG: leucine-rich repeat domain-containing protein [Lachnospiraceae bacterium]|nr:leucine-rich repeat domain-containing protein [Lachnospiraceae bacterium]